MDNLKMKNALLAAQEDQIVFDLEGVERKYDRLKKELPEVSVRFAIKSCPVDEVLRCLADRGAGFDAASPNEIEQAVSLGVSIDRIHYGNTIKSDRQIIEAVRFGIRDFATDSPEDVEAVAARTQNARVYCRLATDGDGALWGLSHKFGCSAANAVEILRKAGAKGATPAGLSIHVGSQQMQAGGWQRAFDRLAEVLLLLKAIGITPEYVNLGGGLPALGYVDTRGRPLIPRLDEIFAAIRSGMRRLRRIAGPGLDFIVEPGRYMVADQGAIRAHVSRLSTRQSLSGERQYWLYLSCGKFNGLYETDKLQYRLFFPTRPGRETVPAIIAGPTCDSDDTFLHEQGPVHVPKGLMSGDPVWILSCGAYSTSYMTQGFNGFKPLPLSFIRKTPAPARTSGGLTHPAEPQYAGYF